MFCVRNSSMKERKFCVSLIGSGCYVGSTGIKEKNLNIYLYFLYLLFKIMVNLVNLVNWNYYRALNKVNISFQYILTLNTLLEDRNNLAKYWQIGKKTYLTPRKLTKCYHYIKSISIYIGIHYTYIVVYLPDSCQQVGRLWFMIWGVEGSSWLFGCLTRIVLMCVSYDCCPLFICITARLWSRCCC